MFQNKLNKIQVDLSSIDHAHHDTQANRALMETVAMDLAFEVLLQSYVRAGDSQVANLFPDCS